MISLAAVQFVRKMKVTLLPILPSLEYLIPTLLLFRRIIR